MKNLCRILLVLAFQTICAHATAQEPDIEQQLFREMPQQFQEMRDSVIFRDSLLISEPVRVAEGLEGSSIMDNLPEGVSIRHSFAMSEAIDSLIKANGSVLSDGYRIRIYFNNSREAREESMREESRFLEMYPRYRTYRSFKNPFFKVTVGDFRTKSDAQIALSDIVLSFPSSFIVKEKIKFPLIDLSCPVRVDTLKIPMDTVQVPVRMDTPRVDTVDAWIGEIPDYTEE